MRIRNGEMVFWRFKGIGAYRFGFTSNAGGGLTRMGLYNGDYNNGLIVDENEIEWRKA